MKAQLVSKRPCRLVAGDIRRIPQDERHPPVGYLIGCPSCGRGTTVAVGGFSDLGQQMDIGSLTLLKPAQCGLCRKEFTLSNGSLTPVPDP